MSRAKFKAPVRGPSLQVITIVVQLLFVSVLALRLISLHVFPTLEITALLLVFTLMWKASHRRLLVALLPFLVLLLSYQILRGFADDMTHVDIHITDLVTAEKALFGGIVPAAFLQAHIAPGAWHGFIDVFANTIYLTHFVTPLILAVILWHSRREWYWRYVLGLVLLSYMAFATYLLFPAAPPWWATKYGYLVDQPVSVDRFIAPYVVEIAGPNPVAAMPSLHCAWPTYFLIVSIAVWGKRGWWLLSLVLAMAFSCVYLGHHYVIDIIAGIIYALAAFGLLSIGPLVGKPTEHISQGRSAEDRT